MASSEKLVQDEQGCCDKFATSSGLCCFMSSGEYKHNPLAEVVQNDQRRCTDLPCCIILILSLISELVLILHASQHGASPRLLMHGYDARMTIIPPHTFSSAQICDSSNKQGSYAIWPDLSYTNIRICAPSCDFTNDTLNGPLVNGPMQKLYESTSFMNAYCLPTGGEDIPGGFDTSSESYQRAVSDLQTAAWLIFIMAFVSVIISFIYLKLISLVGRFLIVLTIVLVLCGGIMLSWLLIQNGIDDMKAEETNTIGEMELICGIVFAVLLFFFILALWFMRRNIELVIEMLNEASYAIRDIKFTLLFPIFISFLAIAFITFWTVEALFIYSVKTENKPEWPDWFAENTFYSGSEYFNLEFNSHMQQSMIWHFLMLFYISQVIIYYGYMVLAGTFADWYFSLWADKDAKIKRRGNATAELSKSPICESLWRVTRFHLGSLALGAMIILIIRIIQGIVTYIKKKAIASSGGNPCVKCVFCCIQCCLKCCECIFNKINKEGFIFTTIYGTSYCYSSFTAIKILMHNIGRTVMVEGVSKYTELFGRIAISSLTTGFAVLIMKYNNYYSDNLSSYLFPAIVIFVMSYVVGALFMMVFEVAVETIFLCFLVDEEVHNGEAKFANHGLTEMAKFVEKSEIRNDEDSGYGSVNSKSKNPTDDRENVDYTAI